MATRCITMPLCKCALFSITGFLSCFAVASENPAPPEISSKIWVTSGFLSYHPNRKANYNERNTGIGLEYHLNDESALTIGHYRNSVRKDTTYLEYVYTPLKIGNVRLGGAAGVLDGYPYLNHGKYAPVLMPVATVTFRIFDRNVGINAVYIPSLIPRVDSSVAIQFKFAVDN